MTAKSTWTGDRSSAYYTHGDYTVQRDRAAGEWMIWFRGDYVGTERTLKLAKAAVERHEAAEQKWDLAIEAGKAERTTDWLSNAEHALDEAADCADQAVIDGLATDETWYTFAVGIAANDSRSAHLFN